MRVAPAPSNEHASAGRDDPKMIRESTAAASLALACGVVVSELLHNAHDDIHTSPCQQYLRQHRLRCLRREKEGERTPYRQRDANVLQRANARLCSEPHTPQSMVHEQGGVETCGWRRPTLNGKPVHQGTSMPSFHPWYTPASPIDVYMPTLSV